MRLDKLNQLRKNINIYVYKTIDKLLCFFFHKFTSFLSFSQTESASLKTLINRVFYFYYCY